MFLPTILAMQGLNEFHLGDLDLKSFSQDWGTAQKNRSVDSHPLRLGGKTYETGVGTHAMSECTIQLQKDATRFHAVVGVDDETEGLGSVRFIVFVDDKKVFDSGTMRGKTPPKTVDVDLKGAKILSLEVEDAGDGIDHDHADWADASISYHSKKPMAYVVSSNQPDPILAPIDKVHTSLNGARAIGTTPGKEFVFRVPVTGKMPIKVTTGKLPDGLVFDSTRRIITGRVKTAGVYKVRIDASGPGGKDSETLKIVAGKDKLAQTPPMGWNSWNVWGLSVDTDKVRAAADAFVKLGLADNGYTFVNVDDGWEKGRADNGEITTNERFQSIKSLCDYVHSLGLKVGIYSSPGPKTCGGYEGSYRHEEEDAESYAKWGIDYLKYDWCSYGGIVRNPDLDGLKLPYIKMKNALEASDRDIVFSLCQYGMGDVFKWGRSVGGNLWRTTGDINDSWGSMSGIGFDHSRRSPFAGPGGWNDPDMLVVGWLGWGPNIRPTKLTKHEQVTHITMWSMLAAPLLLGCDLTRIDDFTLRLITNPDVIDVDQDTMGKAAVRVWQEGKVEIWKRPLDDGSSAVAVFNRGHMPVSREFAWKQFDLKGSSHSVRDLWQRKDLGRKSSLKLTVPAHGALMFKVK
ncbi:MAG: NPCBM/NEW2 domain-containing protein [Armatimonadetes bacterium]|nr:NPCBM/NEW2 domain-containing protein [Armatimonadota bacterium]MBS1727324.1 NPCBM/NEW2 domain-containing protein [Armatimonadota bacterium]